MKIQPVALHVILVSDLDLQGDEEQVINCLDISWGDAEHTLVTVSDFVTALEEYGESDVCTCDVNEVISALREAEATCPGLLVSVQG